MNEILLYVLLIIVIFGFFIIYIYLKEIDKNFRKFHEQWRSADKRDLEFQRDSMQGEKNQGMIINDIRKMQLNQIEEEDDELKKIRLRDVSKNDQ